MRAREYVTTLEERQRREGWSDRAMARELAVHHTTWRGIRLGRHGPGLSFMRRAMARFPEYNGLALMVLLSDVSDSHGSVSPSQEAA